MRLRIRLMPGTIVLAVLLPLIGTACSSNAGKTADPVDASDGGETTWDVTHDSVACRQGQLPNESGECVFAPSMCETWQRPTVGGTCVSVGPRACPKVWNPQSSAECQTEKLLPCPDGTVESEDKVWCRPVFDQCGENQVPLLGGGCQAVGITEEQLALQEPVFDQCPRRSLALPGGGCAAVGPRGCSKSYDPQSDEQCEIGDMAPCPDGWVEGEENLFCQPDYAADCEPGHRPVLGGACVPVINFSACPPGPFPVPPDGASQVLYVDAASDCVSGCGTTQAPYPSLGSAIAVAMPGGAVLLAAGSYDGGASIDKPLTIKGVCADKVFITGAVPVSAPDGDSPVAATLVVQPDSGTVRISDVTISGSGAGLVGVGPDGLNDVKLHLNNLALPGNQGVALYLQSLSVEGDGVWIHEVVPSTEGILEGRGIMVRDGVSLAMSNSLVEKARYFGFDVAGDNITLTIDHSTIRNTLSGEGFLHGAGINVNGNKSTTKVSLEQCLLEHNASAQARVLSGELRLNQCMVRNGAVEATGERGYGLVASGDGRIIAEETVVRNQKLAGVLAVEDSDPVFPKVRLSKCAIVETKEGLYGPWENVGGVGINTNSGGTIVAEGTLVWDSRSTGTICSDKKSQLTLRGSLVGHTWPEVGTEQAGMGVQIQIGCTGLIEDSVIESNSYAGLVCVDNWLADYGTSTTVQRSTFRGADLDTEWRPERGIEALDGGLVTLTNSLIENTGEIAFMCDGTGTSKVPVSITNSVLRNTFANEDGAAGHGLYAKAGCTVNVNDSLLDGNREAAIQLLQDDTSAALVGIIVRNTIKSEAYEIGMALDISTGASALVQGSLLEDNDVLGIGLEVTQIAGITSEKPASLELLSSIVRNQKPLTDKDGTQKHGRGIEVQWGGVVSMTDSVVEGNSGVGIQVGHEGSTLTMIDSVVRGTHSLLNADGSEEGGHGVQIALGAHADLTRCLLEKNVQIAFSVDGTDSEGLLHNCLVQDQIAFSSGKYGWGAGAQYGGFLGIYDSLIQRNVAAGVRSGQALATVVLEKSVVRDTLPDAAGAYGRGIEAGYESIVEVRDSLLEGNTEVGLNAGHPGTRVSLARTVIRQTLLDPSGVRGQAVNLQQNADLTATACLFEENAQSGLAVTLEGTAELVGIIVRNTNPALARTLGGDEFADGGFALAAVYGAQATATHSLFQSSATVGLFTEGDDALLDLADCAVISTTAGGGFVQVPGSDHLEFQPFGDGIFISLDASLTADRVLVYDNSRCGLYWRGDGSISNSVVLGNTAFGIAIDKQTKGGVWEGNGNQLFGNCLACSGLTQVHEVDVDDGTLVPVLGASLGISKEGSGSL